MSADNKKSKSPTLLESVIKKLIYPSQLPFRIRIFKKKRKKTRENEATKIDARKTHRKTRQLSLKKTKNIERCQNSKIKKNTNQLGRWRSLKATLPKKVPQKVILCNPWQASWISNHRIKDFQAYLKKKQLIKIEIEAEQKRVQAYYFQHRNCDHFPVVIITFFAIVLNKSVFFRPLWKQCIL